MSNTQHISPKLHRDRRSPETWHDWFRHAPQALLVVDGGGDLIAANLRAAGLLDGDETWLMGRPFSTLLAGGADDSAMPWDGSARPDGAADDASVAQVELRRADGETFPAEIHSYRLETAGDYVCCLLDISEHQKAADESSLLLRLIEATCRARDVRAALQGALEIVCDKTRWGYGEAWLPRAKDGVLERAASSHRGTPEWARFDGLSQEFVFPPGIGLPGRTWERGRPEWIPDVSATPESLFLRAELARQTGVHAALGTPIVADGESLAVLVFFMSESRSEDDRLVTLVSGVARELSGVFQRKRAHEQLENRSRELAALASRLANAQEKERQRVSRELHDQVGGGLGTLGLALSHAAQTIDRGELTTGLELLHEARTLLEQTTERLRDVIYDLRPPMLDQRGLLSALRWYADRFTSSTGIATTVDGVRDDRRLPPTVEIGLFRIAQEALNNVAKHSHASHAVIHLEQDPQFVRMVVKDDGVGFDAASATDAVTPGWGLRIIRERATALCGQSRIESLPGRGARVSVELLL